MKLRYLIVTKDGWYRPFYTLDELENYAKENNYHKNIVVKVEQIKKGIWTVGTLRLFI